MIKPGLNFLRLHPLTSGIPPQNTRLIKYLFGPIKKLQAVLALVVFESMIDYHVNTVFTHGSRYNHDGSSDDPIAGP